MAPSGKIAIANPRGDDVNLRAAAQMLEYQAIAERIARDRPGRLLDWGCGWGQVSDLLVRAGMEVELFDYRGDASPDANVPLERYPGLEAYVSSDPVRLPYPEDSFDAVLSCGVLEHVEDPDASLEEIKRVLRPRGTFYCFKLPNRFSYLEVIARAAGLYYHGQAPLDRVYTLHSASDLLLRHGYQVRELRRANMLPLTLTSARAGRAAPAIWAANRMLARVPVLSLAATNVELVAIAPGAPVRFRRGAPTTSTDEARPAADDVAAPQRPA